MEGDIQFPMYKGLQQPLEIFGLQGRYIIWAAITVGTALLGCFLFYILINFLVALIWIVISISFGAGLILFKQRKGLHSKKEHKGIFVFVRSADL